MIGSVLLPGCRERTFEPGEDFERHACGLWLPAGDDTVPAPADQPLGIDLFAGAVSRPTDLAVLVVMALLPDRKLMADEVRGQLKRIGIDRRSETALSVALHQAQLDAWSSTAH